MTALFDVAQHLSVHAKKETGTPADAFGRSAFNRYYYGSYLSARELLAQIDTSWSRTGHSAIPALLEGALLKQVRDAARKQQQAGVWTATHASTRVRHATSAVSEIASILRVAYAVRVVADYEPQSAVEFDANGFRLSGHTDAEARHWEQRVDQMKGVLLGVCKELAIV